MNRVLLYAPNVHVGGGAVLLRALLESWLGERPLMVWLDERSRANLPLPDGASVRWVSPNVVDRMAAELSVHRSAQPGDQLLCFHGLPPLLRSRAKVAVFEQNRIHLGQMPLQHYAWRTRWRLRIEQQMSRRCRAHVDAYWVQTPSMAEALRNWWGVGEPPPVRVLGFAPVEGAAPAASAVGHGAEAPRFDYVYVADGEAHKNHRCLVQAWALLAQQGVKPSLALTLSPRDGALREWVQAQTVAHGLRIHHLAPLSHAEVLALYRRAGALVFPSLGESYGLPLIEARQVGLPILAGELDFVRDVCEPVQTFNPHSAQSLARAVLRHQARAEAPPLPATAHDFWQALLGAA